MILSDWAFPERGVVFWPVGNGDAITVIVDDETVIQIDINHYDKSEDDDDDRVPVVDRLIDLLHRPEGSDKSILPVLAITHHDADHCSGFTRLVDEVDVCELWLTLRSFIEHKNEGKLTDDGKAIYDEACRRRAAEVAACKKGERAKPGDRLRIIGNADVLDDADWRGFPTELLTSAGQFIPNINDEDRSDVIDVFVHTPFRDDTQDGSRNSSSLGVQLTLKSGECIQRFLLLGDLEYEQIDAFFDKSEDRGNEERLEWDVLLAPHHGSRNAVLKKDGEKWVEADAVDDLRNYKQDGARIVVSSRSFEDIGPDDTDPPHQDAVDVYEDLVGKANVLYTADRARGSDSDPIEVTVTEEECGQTRAKLVEKFKTIGAITSRDRVRPGDSGGRTGDQEFA